MRMIFRCDPALSDHLPRPLPARTALPDWLRAMPAKAHSDIHGREIRTVKQCPPFVDAMMEGFLIPLPCDVAVDRGRFSWDWDLPEPSVPDHARAPLSFHVAAQLVGALQRESEDLPADRLDRDDHRQDQEDRAENVGEDGFEAWHGRFTRFGISQAILLAARGVSGDVVGRTHAALLAAGALREVPVASGETTTLSAS